MQASDRPARISLRALRDAYHQDPGLHEIPFRSLYALALAHDRLGDQLEPLVRRVGQGKALEIAMITDADGDLREELIDRGMPGPTGRRVPVERVTMVALRAYIADRRRGPAVRMRTKPRLPGGKRGPRVRWPEHLVRVLARLMDETTWTRLRQAFELFRFGQEVPPPMAAGEQPGTRALTTMGHRQLKSLQKRMRELNSMLLLTIKSRPRAGA
jgi:hypothetical protein